MVINFICRASKADKNLGSKRKPIKMLLVYNNGNYEAYLSNKSS